MGSLLVSKDSSMPQIYNYEHYHKTANEINLISSQIGILSDMQITIHEDTLHFNYKNWKLSKVKAVLGLFPHQANKMAEGDQPKNKQEYAYLQQIQVDLTLRQLYTIHSTIKDFKQHETLPCKEESETLVETPTELVEKEDNSCQICFDEECDMVLPCGHAFGANCISKYIIDKDEKKCPKCRIVFLDGRQTLQKKLFTIIGEDQKGVYVDLRNMLLDVIKETNAQGVASALKCFKEYKEVTF